MSASLAKLEAKIGHKFKDLKLLERAVTHRSWAYENFAGETDERIHEAENESLEFIGDSVLGLIVAEQLFLRNPQASEGDLTLMKHNLVSGRHLAALSESLGWASFSRLGGSEVKGGRKKKSLLTNTLEAVIGAVFLGRRVRHDPCRRHAVDGGRLAKRDARELGRFQIASADRAAGP